MTVHIPHCTAPAWPEDIPTARFASHIAQALPIECRVAIIGLADDLGVRLNGGRPGAREGPRAFRAALARYGTADPEGWRWARVFDAGDIEPAPGHDAAALARTHDRVYEAVSAILDANMTPVGIGGGHDLTLPFVRAVTAKRGPLAGLYFDPHLDVRAEPGSGMAFRGLLESGAATSLINIGFSALTNSREHVDYFRSRRGRFDVPSPDEGPVREFPREALFVSFDLDAIDMAYAPGVSAPNPTGMSSAQATRWAYLAGRHANVRCFDLMELCPAHDEGGRTARLAAHLFLSFLRGFSERSG